MGCCHSSPRARNSPSTDGNIPSAISTISTTVTGPPPTHRSSRHSLRPSHHHHPHPHAPPRTRINTPLHHAPAIVSPTPQPWTPSRLSLERTSFFDTRVSGQATVWGALRLAAEALRSGDVRLAQGIVDAAGLTVPSGRLEEGSYDERGGFYALEGWVVGEPMNLVRGGEEETEMEDGDADGDVGSGKGEGGDVEDAGGGDGGEEEEGLVRRVKGKNALVGEGDLVKVKIRLSDRGGPDLRVSVGREQSVRILIRSILEAGELSTKKNIKLAYMGRILKENESLTRQGWKEGHVVNAMVFGG